MKKQKAQKTQKTKDSKVVEEKKELPATSAKKFSGWWGGILLLSIFAMYARVLGYPLLKWDDKSYLERRVFWQIAEGSQKAWVELLSPRAAWAGEVWEYFPLRDLSYGLDAWWGGMRASVFHGTHLVLFLLILLMTWEMGRRLGLGPFWSWIAVAMVGFHPLCVEPVAWVSGRKDLLYVLFTLLALWCADHALFDKKKNEKKTEEILKVWRMPWFLLACFCGVGSLLSKGAGVIVVPLLGVWLFWRGRHCFSRWIRGYGIFVLISMVWAGWSVWVGVRNQIVDMTGVAGYSLARRCFHALGMPLWSLVRWFLPWELSPSYEDRFLYAAWWSDPWAWLSLLCLVGLLLLWRRRWPCLGPLRIFLLSLCIVIFPYSGVLRVNQHHADRFLFMVVILCAWGGAAWLRSMSSRVSWLGWVLLPALFVWGLETHHYLPAWQSDFALWAHVYHQDPRHPGATTNLGSMAVGKGRFDDAEKLLLVATKVAPLRYHAWNSMGLVWLYRAWKWPQGMLGREEALRKAESIFLRVLRMPGGERTVTPLWGLGHIARIRGHFRSAEVFFRRGLASRFATERLVLDLATLLWKQGRGEEAKALISSYRRHFSREKPFRLWLEKHHGSPPLKPRELWVKIRKDPVPPSSRPSTRPTSFSAPR